LVSIQETAYPRLKSNYSKKELDDIYTTTPSELAWMIQSAKGSVSKVGQYRMKRQLRKQSTLVVEKL